MSDSNWWLMCGCSLARYLRSRMRFLANSYSDYLTCIFSFKTNRTYGFNFLKRNNVVKV